MTTEPMTEPNRSENFKAIANLLNLSTLKSPPLRNWRTGDSAEDLVKSTRFRACLGLLVFTLAAIITVCVWLW